MMAYRGRQCNAPLITDLGTLW